MILTKIETVPQVQFVERNTHSYYNMNLSSTTTDVETVTKKVRKFTDMIEIARENVTDERMWRRDPLTIMELVNMATKSLHCNHTTKSHVNVSAHERTPKNWDEIPSLVEDMGLSFSPNEDSTISMRSNQVVCMYVADLMAMIEFVERYETDPTTIHVLVVDAVLSMTHFGMIKITYDIMMAYLNETENCYLYVCMSEDNIRTSNTILGETKNMNLVPAQHYMSVMDSCKNRFISSSLVSSVIVNACESSEQFDYACESDFDFKSIIAPMSTFGTIDKVSRTTKRAGMVMEMIPLCPTNQPVIRVTTSIVGPNKNRLRTITTQQTEYTEGLIAWFTHRIRPMKLGKRCYDCAIALMIAKSISRLIKNVPGTTISREKPDWSESFAVTITADLIDDVD